MKFILPYLLGFLSISTFAQSTGHSFADSETAITGVWKSIGDGYLLQVEKKSITLYSYTSKYCYTEKNDYVTDLLLNSSKFFLNRTKDTLSVYLNDFGERTKDLQDEKKFCRLRSLPKNCSPLTTTQANDPEYLFELLWSTLTENYAFAKERNMNWDQIYRDYRPRINSKTTQNDLFNLMGEIVTQTKDQHTKIISKDGTTKQYSGVPSALLLNEVFSQQDSIKDFNQYAGQFFKSQYDGISNELLGGKGTKVANGKIEWGDVSPDIGYIQVHSLTGFAAGKLPRKIHLDTLTLCMNKIMKSFQAKKAIIIDVSLNFGGYDAAGLTISGYFADKPTPVYTKNTFQNGTFSKGTEFVIRPADGFTFTKPVYVLTSDITRSAAETFVIQMKSLPHVTVIGTNTLGIQSDMLGKSIGDFYLTISNEKYITKTGAMYEVTGVDVDREIPVFPRDNMFHGHRDAVRNIIKIIENE